MEDIIVASVQPEFDGLRWHSLDTVIPGTVCLSLFPEDARWYRAVIDAVDTNSGAIKVTYIDYGNDSIVDIKQLRRMPADFVVIPAMALKCSLDALENVADDVNEMFENLVIDLTFTVKFIRSLDDTTHVRLYHSGGIDLIETLTPKKNDESQQSPVTNNLEEENAERTEFYITEVESASRFWIQLLSNAEYMDDIVDGIEALTMKPVDNIVDGDIVLALHSIYNGWYRVQIKDIEGRKRGLYVDYGGFVDISLENIRQCPNVFKRIPWMAIECSMKKDDWTSEKVNKIKENPVLRLTGVLVEKCEGVQMIDSLHVPGFDSEPVKSAVESIAHQKNVSSDQKITSPTVRDL